MYDWLLLLLVVLVALLVTLAPFLSLGG